MIYYKKVKSAGISSILCSNEHLHAGEWSCGSTPIEMLFCCGILKAEVVIAQQMRKCKLHDMASDGTTGTKLELATYATEEPREEG